MRKFLGERRAVGAKCARSGRKSRTLFVTFGIMIHCIRALVVMLFCSLQVVREEAGEVWGWRIDRGPEINEAGEREILGPMLC